MLALNKKIIFVIGLILFPFLYCSGQVPKILDIKVSSKIVLIDKPVTLSVNATGDGLTYRFDIGNAIKTDFSSDSSFTYTFAKQGHFNVIVTVKDFNNNIEVKTVVITVLKNIPNKNSLPQTSSQLALNHTDKSLWVVNPDNDSVTHIFEDTNKKNEVKLSDGCSPRSVSVDSKNNAWITCFGLDTIEIVSPENSIINTISLPYGSAPYGIVNAKISKEMFVSLYGKGELIRFSENFNQTSRIKLGTTPRTVATYADGSRVLVTKFISTDDQGKVWDIKVNKKGFTDLKTIFLLEDVFVDDTQSSSRGIFNYISGLAISPDGTKAWVGGKKDNIRRGMFKEGQNLANFLTVRTILTEIDLTKSEEIPTSRRDVDNSEGISSLAYSPLGDWVFLTLQGNGRFGGYDALVEKMVPLQDSRTDISGIVGIAPQAILADDTKLYVHNFMSRDISVIDYAPIYDGEIFKVQVINTIKTINEEKLSPEVLLGKQLFYQASEIDSSGQEQSRMSAEGYISCATCHIDGGHDGQTWDFTERGEGFRNTTDLRGRSGMGHGNVHWSANFDEIQDFENDIRNNFGGKGFMSDTDFANTKETLGPKKAGLSPSLDALAAYVTSLNQSSLPRSPYKNRKGTLTVEGVAGKAIFKNLECGKCHGGSSFTDANTSNNVALHNVGTLSDSSGQRKGEKLIGIDTPTLLGLWDTAPYLHDGSARTLEEVFNAVRWSGSQIEDWNLTNGVNKVSDIHGARGLAYVQFMTRNSSIQLSNIDGGTTAGVGRATLRYSAKGEVELDVKVNDTTTRVNLKNSNNFKTDIQLISFNVWSLKSFPITLNTGKTNSITISVVSGEVLFALDELRLSNADDFKLAEPHQRVKNLSPEEQNNLITYLLQLDGQDGLSSNFTISMNNLVEATNQLITTFESYKVDKSTLTDISSQIATVKKIASEILTKHADLLTQTARRTVKTLSSLDRRFSRITGRISNKDKKIMIIYINRFLKRVERLSSKLNS
jgi:cytochrome c peroxidase